MRLLHAGIFTDHALGGDVVLTSGFHKLGINVRQFDYRAIAEQQGARRMNYQLIQQAKEADLLFIGKGELIRPSALAQVRASGTRVALWYGDFRPHPPQWLISNLSNCDVFFMTSAGKVLRHYYALGKPQRAAFFLFPADPDVSGQYGHIPKSVDPPLFTGTFASFVGPERRTVMNYLIQRGDVQIIGSPTRYVGNDLLRRIYRRLKPPPYFRGEEYIAKIIRTKLGIGVSAFQDVKYYTSDRLAHYLTFGTPYLAYRFPGCEDLFRDGVDLIYYDGIKELDEKLTYYLQHPDESEKIGREGQRRMLSEYSATNMVSLMLDIIETGGSGRYPWTEIYP